MDKERELKERYVGRIQRCVPELGISHTEINTEGLVNDVVMVNREWVFRFAKTEAAKEDLKRETSILKLVRQYVDLPVPVFRPIEEGAVMYRLIPGEALAREDILRQDAQGQDRVAAQLGTFLDQLHNIPKSTLEARAIPHSVTRRSREDWIQLYEDVQQELFPLLMGNAKAWVHGHFETLLRDASFMDCRPTLMNGDLGPYHILYDRERGRLNGVIDFGTAGIGDPACDVSLLINSYGESFVRRVARFYPAIEGMIERARFWAGTLELQWALGGVRTGDLSWFTVHIGRARDRMPIGIGWDVDG